MLMKKSYDITSIYKAYTCSNKDGRPQFTFQLIQNKRIVTQNQNNLLYNDADIKIPCSRGLIIFRL